MLFRYYKVTFTVVKGFKVPVQKAQPFKDDI